MFDFIRKPLVWEAWDEGLDGEIDKPTRFSLKNVQDLVVYRLLRPARNQQIAEIGAGHSRILPSIAKENTCIAVEKFEGKGGGPTEAQELPDVRNVSAYLGEYSPQLAPSSLDIVFSISVVEHVGDAALSAFHADQLRVLKPGGMFVHAIDLYLQDEPEEHYVERFRAYRDWVTGSPDVEPVGEVYEGACAFTCDLATNPDDVMHAWGRVAPSLIELRQVAQCVSVLVAGRKLETEPGQAGA